MGHELEAKLRVKSHEDVRQSLKSSGAVFRHRVLEHNWIYDRPDGSLRSHGMGMRLRAYDVLEGDPLPPVLTVKGAIEPGPFKSRAEHEARLEDPAAWRDLLAALGFAVILYYEKRRESWQLDDCLVELDEPPHLGRFVEIEGPSEAGIRSAIAALNLSGCEEVRRSYVALLLGYCQDHRIQPAVLKFGRAH